MIPLADIVERVTRRVPGARLEVAPVGAGVVQPSLRVDRGHGVEVALALREDPALCFDYVSNVTGVDWLDAVIREKVIVRRVVDGVEREFEDVIEIKQPGHLEAVYHLYSMRLGHGPLVIRLRTEDRAERVQLPSLTRVWRGCEFQEREVFDLYGIRFEGHPDLRRILMWEGFQAHPMRKDYVEPDDYEYEPTPHGEVLERARRHQAGGPPGAGEVGG